MRATTREFLQSVCQNIPWNYAVFWKLHLQKQMVLKWEDAWFDVQSQMDSMGSTLGDFYLCSSDELSSNCELSTHDGISSECTIGLAVADMSNVHYAMGEGIVGEVAYTGSHRWVRSENISAGELFPKCPDEWLLHFVAGIKTILLVPVIPHGVLQVGSLHMVPEDLAMVASLLSKFNQLSTINQLMPSGMTQDSSDITEKYMPEILDTASENDSNLQAMVLIEGKNPISHSIYDDKEDREKAHMFRLSRLEEELHTISSSNFSNLGFVGDHANETMNTCMDGGVMGQPFVEKDAKDLHSFFSFPKHCELHKALGPAFLGHSNQYLSDSITSGNDVCSSPSLEWNRDLVHYNDPSPLESGVWCAKGYDAEPLLQDVVSNAFSGSDDNSYESPKSTKSLTISSGLCAASSVLQTQYEGSAFEEKFPGHWSRGTSEFGAWGGTATAYSSPSDSPYGNMMSPLIEQDHQQKGSVCLHPHRGSKPSNFSKRRARPGESNKPRPRDRQLIQDRVKELRELVPNGAKCSIDGLLDRTIKHMLFLKSVTNQADKLRQWIHKDVSGQRNTKSSEIKAGRQNGVSWAFEVGSDKLCPIVVEDLEYPGHLLIEMVCNDHGRFLEIAEAIRQLELTVLKGVMKTHSDNTWAHFIVEASSDFHRLDIFFPLMQLLQQNRTPISSKI